MGVAERVRGAAVGHAAHAVSLHRITAREEPATAVTRHLDVAALVGRGRITVVDPEEGADGHRVAGLHHGADAVGLHFNDFARAKILQMIIAKVRQRAGLLHRNHRALTLTDDHRRAAITVAHRVERAIPRHEKQRETALDQLLDALEPVDDRILRRDDRRDELRLPKSTGRRRILQLGVAVVEELLLEGLHIGDKTHRHERIDTKMRLHHQRLRIRIGDDTETHVAAETGEVRLKLGPERRVLNVVNGSQELPARLKHRHATAVGSQM